MSTKDNFRVDVTNVVTGKQEYLELDDAKIVKYTGSFVKGEYDTEDWEAKDLDTNSIIYVQFNDDDEVVAVYDMYVKYPVTVNGKETKDVEYWLKDFNDVTVTFDHKYEMINTIEMGNKDIDDFTVTYYNGDTKIGTTLDEKGTEASAAMVLTNPVQGLVIGALCGLSQAASVIVGKRLGSGDEDAAYVAEVEVLVAVGHAARDDGAFGEGGTVFGHRVAPLRCSRIVQPA